MSDLDELRQHAKTLFETIGTVMLLTQMLQQRADDTDITQYLGHGVDSIITSLKRAEAELLEAHNKCETAIYRAELSYVRANLVEQPD